MNTFQLSCFLAVAETLNFARAAEQLHVTQPAVTQQIHSLESDLNVKLFKRTTRTVKLTEEGKIFIHDAKQIVALSQRAIKRFEDPRNEHLQFQAFLRYADGNKSYDINGASAKFQGTVYNIGLLATGLYPVELSFGSIAPFGSIGAVYTFGSLNTTYQGGTQNKSNLSGGGILAQAGLQYSYHILAFRVYGEYLYDFTPVNNPYIKSLSGFSVGAELGIKF